MNILLWVLQAFLALMCLGGGTFKIFEIDELQATVNAMRQLPHALWAVMGAVEILGGLLLILPGLLGKQTQLTPIAAALIAVQSLLISALYAVYGDSAPLPYAVVMAILAGVIAYGRLKLRPFSLAT